VAPLIRKLPLFQNIGAALRNRFWTLSRGSVKKKIIWSFGPFPTLWYPETMKPSRKATSHRKGRRREPEFSVSDALEKFQGYEDSPAHRKGTFKINASFEEALDRVLRLKTKPKPTK
jgi:hypothetical protein